MGRIPDGDADACIDEPVGRLGRSAPRAGGGQTVTASCQHLPRYDDHLGNDVETTILGGNTMGL